LTAKTNLVRIAAGTGKTFPGFSDLLQTRCSFNCTVNNYPRFPYLRSGR